MIKVRLYVSGAPQAEDDLKQNNEWGIIGLENTPSVGDTIHLLHDEEFHYLRVDRVLHYAILIPPPPIGRENPFVEIEAAWTGYDLSQYTSG